MPMDNFNRLVATALDALNQGDTLLALVLFEQALVLDRTPTVCSYLGYCLAVEGKNLGLARAYCRDAIRAEPDNSLHYLNLGRVYLLAGKKQKAIRTLHFGLIHGPAPLIVLELKGLGIRRPPVCTSLHRHHPLNRCLGWLFDRLGLR